MKGTIRKVFLLALSMCLTFLFTPFSAFGAEAAEATTVENESTLSTLGLKTPVSYREYTATVTDGKATLTYEDRTCTDYLSITQAEKIGKLTYLEDNCWYVVDQDYEIDYIVADGDVHLILVDGFTLECTPLSTGYENSPISINEGNSLTIYGQENNTGTLIAPGEDEDYMSGIDVLGELNIHGGNIQATGGMYGAGIGTGENYNNSGTINIYGGTITATGGMDAAGIGNGAGATADEVINIYGGTISATGGSGAAGIGAGSYLVCEAKGCYVDSSHISIYGGTITATGGKLGAGIGGGDMTSLTKLTIAGGNITAQGGKFAAGIGGGNLKSGKGGNAYNITISGGTIKAIGGEEYNEGEYGTAGIGGGAGGSLYGLTITGGDITAIGGKGTGRGCGIGGCYGKNIVISGGTVHASSSPHRGSAAIGCDYGYNSYSITITGGYVDAYSAYNGAAIGSGSWSPTNKNSYVKITGGTIVAESNGDGDSSSACTAIGVGLRNGNYQDAGTLTIDPKLTIYNTTGSSKTVIKNSGGDMVATMTGIRKVLIQEEEITSQGVTNMYGERTSDQTDDEVNWIEAEDVIVVPTDDMAKLEVQREYAKKLLNLTDEEYQNIIDDPDAYITMGISTYVAKITDASVSANGEGYEFALRVEMSISLIRDGSVVDSASHTVTQEEFADMKGGLYITIKVPEGKTVTEILHTNDDGTVVYDDFTPTGTATFSYDEEANTVSIYIEHCSHLIMMTEDTIIPDTSDATPVAALALVTLLAVACAAIACRKVMH